jgi:hypothetical protein
MVRKKSENVFFRLANPGSSPGQAPESSIFERSQIIWTPVFTGVRLFTRSSRIWRKKDESKNPAFFLVGDIAGICLFFFPLKFPGSVFSLPRDARMEEA